MKPTHPSVYYNDIPKKQYVIERSSYSCDIYFSVSFSHTNSQKAIKHEFPTVYVSRGTERILI